jgi:hypothetical protein
MPESARQTDSTLAHPALSADSRRLSPFSMSTMRGLPLACQIGELLHVPKVRRRTFRRPKWMLRHAGQTNLRRRVGSGGARKRHAFDDDITVIGRIGFDRGRRRCIVIERFHDGRLNGIAPADWSRGGGHCCGREQNRKSPTEYRPSQELTHDVSAHDTLAFFSRAQDGSPGCPCQTGGGRRPL